MATPTLQLYITGAMVGGDPLEGGCMVLNEGSISPPYIDMV
jgi:hypothetical protein